MKRISIFVAALLVFNLLAANLTAADKRKNNEQQLRNLTGQVLDRSDRPLSEAIVYLQNTKTMAVKTFITDASGAFRFHALSPNTDYQVYAEYKGQKSDTKTLSAFDSRQNVTMYLRINTGGK